MAGRTLVFLVLLSAAVADKATNGATDAKRRPVAPTDIIYATGDLIYDIHSAVYEHVEAVVTKHGIHTKAKHHFNSIVGDDVIGSACSKIGCNKKDVTEKLDQVHATVQQGKAQAYEHGAKLSNHLNGFADHVVTKFETHAPASYKGTLQRNFVDLLLVTLYLVFVVYVAASLALYGFKKVLSIFCCVCCCGCCLRRKGGVAKKNGKTNGKKGADADAKAAPAKASAKGKAGSKK